MKNLQTVLRNITYVLLTLFFLTGVFAQTNDPDTIIKMVEEKFDSVQDYSVDVNIHVDINVLKMPDSKAKIYFKQPDKFKFDSEGFAIFPRQSMNVTPTKLFEGDYSSIYVKEDLLDSISVHLIKIIPNSDTTDIILSTLWIDKESHVVRKIETNTRSMGTMTVKLEYLPETTHPLPSKMIFSLNNKKSKNTNPIRNRPDFKSLSGSVTISYFNYQINSGIDDLFFEDKEE